MKKPAISTCWKSWDAESADEILGPILDVGATAIELEYRVSDEIFREMLPALKHEQPAVVSVHNFFPLLDHQQKGSASGDAFLLSSPDKEERERAVKYTLRTLEYAHEVGAGAVVLHMGKTGMDDGFERLKEEFEDGTLGEAETRNYIERLTEERRAVSRKYLDSALFSLDRLWHTAERLGLKLGIENRYHFREVPNADELEIILGRFEGSNIGYWHDVGHAEVQGLLYGISHEGLLSRFSSHLVGVHLHDAEGTRDHQAPGKGKIDFEMIKRHLPPDAIHVLELSPKVSAEELVEAINHLSDIFD